MKKYFYKGKEIKIGDSLLTTEGFIVKVTEEFIKQNSDLIEEHEEVYLKCITVNTAEKVFGYGDFTIGKVYKGTFSKGITTVISNTGKKLVSTSINVKYWVREPEFTQFEEVSRDQYFSQILEDYKKKFPIGSRVKDVNGNSFIVKGGYTLDYNKFDDAYNVKVFSTIDWSYFLFDGKNEAKLILPLSIIDGVKVYEDTTLYFIANNKVFGSPALEFVNRYGVFNEYNTSLFLTSDEAHKELENLNSLAKYIEMVREDVFAGETSNMYRLIFAKIAKDLAPKDFVPNYYETKYFVYKDDKNELKIREHNSVKYDLVYFDSKKSAEKAIKIMGEYIKYVV